MKFRNAEARHHTEMKKLMGVSHSLGNRKAPPSVPCTNRDETYLQCMVRCRAGCRRVTLFAGGWVAKNTRTPGTSEDQCRASSVQMFDEPTGEPDRKALFFDSQT